MFKKAGCFTLTLDPRPLGAASTIGAARPAAAANERNSMLDCGVEIELRMALEIERGLWLGPDQENVRMLK